MVPPGSTGTEEAISPWGEPSPTASQWCRWRTPTGTSTGTVRPCAAKVAHGGGRRKANQGAAGELGPRSQIVVSWVPVSTGQGTDVTAETGPIRHLVVCVSVGASTTRSRPERGASGGQVMGSIATPRSSPV